MAIRGLNGQLCPLGEGDVPLNQAFEILLTNDKVRLVWNGSMPAALQTVQKLIGAAQRETE